MHDSRSEPTVLFDGNCGFCRTGVAFLQRHQPPGVRYVPMTSDAGRAILIANGFAADYDQSVVLVENGSAYTESTAAWRLAWKMRWPWRVLATPRLIPRPVRDAAYRWVARNRSRFPGSTCAIVHES